MNDPRDLPGYDLWKLDAPDDEPDTESEWDDDEPDRDEDYEICGQYYDGN